MRFFMDPPVQNPHETRYYFGSIYFFVSELKDLAFTSAAVALVFAAASRTGVTGFLPMLFISLLTASVGVIIHELAHKIMAQKFGAHARFIAEKKFMGFSVLIAFVTGFILLAPGAVFFSGHVTKKKSAWIAAVGPLSNFALGILFYLMTFAIEGNLLTAIANVGASVNVYLGVFNLIPYGPLDGAKMYDGHKVLFWSTAAVALLCAYMIGYFG